MIVLVFAAGGQGGVAVFEYGCDGWTGTSVLAEDGRNAVQCLRYLNRQRGGILAFRRQI